jgi:serine protease Do
VVTLILQAAMAARAQDDAQALEHARGLSRAFRAAAKKVVPTVVVIKTSGEAPQRGQRPRGGNPFRGTPFEEFFPEDAPGLNVPFSPAPGLGSGVIIDPAGVILTNNHVVQEAGQVTVQLDDGRQFPAKDIKVDEKTDLAVVRIEAGEPLPAAVLGDSDGLEIGDWVLAVGSPFELEQTVSAGIISAKGRSLGTLNRGTFLQTDAAINPGNSGGPLVNLEGEVVGINTAIVSGSGGYQGVGFAIPINLAKWVTPQLLKTGKVRRSYLGVGIQKITGELAQELKARPGQGVAVQQVFEGSPAAKSGLQEGDIVLTFDDRPLHDAAELQEMVERTEPGSTHRLHIVRDGQPMDLDVGLEAMPEDFDTAARDLPESGQFESAELGLSVMDLTPDMAESLGYQNQSGALVSRADRRGLAYRAGIRDGMLIVSVGKQPVKSVADFAAALENASLAEGLTLEIVTRQGRRTVTLQSS